MVYAALAGLVGGAALLWKVDGPLIKETYRLIKDNRQYRHSS